ncbi:MAG: hypothetical protein ACTSXA_01895 [Candidatus Heimdallarchaeota archaeon]
MSENKTQEKPKFVTEEDMIKDMQILFDKPYLNEKDAQLAYAIGTYMQTADYYQQKELKTAGLQKKLRPLIDYIDKLKLEKIFNECNKIFLHIKTKTRESKIRNEQLRIKVEKLLLEVTEWTSSADKLSIAFFMGFDAYGRLLRQKYYNK